MLNILEKSFVHTMSDHGSVVSATTQQCPIRPTEIITIQFFEDGAIKRSCNFGSNYCNDVKTYVDCPAYPTWQ